jgi:hypothetical protein
MKKFFYSTKLLNIKSKYFIPFTIFEGQFDLKKYQKKKEKKNIKKFKYKSLFEYKNIIKQKEHATNFLYTFYNYNNKKIIKKKWYNKNFINHL